MATAGLEEVVDLKRRVTDLVDREPGITTKRIEKELGLKPNRSLPITSILVQEKVLRKERLEERGAPYGFYTTAAPVRPVTPVVSETSATEPAVPEEVIAPEAQEGEQEPAPRPAAAAAASPEGVTPRERALNFIRTSSTARLRGVSYEEVRQALGREAALKLNDLAQAKLIERRVERGDVRYYPVNDAPLVPEPGPDPDRPETATLRFTHQTHDGENRCVAWLGSKVVLVHRDYVKQVGDGETWLVRLEHRARVVIAYPVKPTDDLAAKAETNGLVTVDPSIAAIARSAPVDAAPVSVKVEVAAKVAPPSAKVVDVLPVETAIAHLRTAMEEANEEVEAAEREVAAAQAKLAAACEARDNLRQRVLDTVGLAPDQATTRVADIC